MRNIWAIARGTIKESVRRKSMLITLVVSILFILAIGAMTEHVLQRSSAAGGEGSELIQTFQIEGTIRTLSFFGAILTLFITMNAIPLEIERRTVYTLLAKPLERYQFMFGKFLGCFLLLALDMVVMAAIAFALIARHDPTIASGLLRSFAVLLVSLTSLCGLVIFFTTFMPATGSALLGLGFYLAGKVPGSFRMIAESDSVNGIVRAAARILYPVVAVVTPRVNKLNFEAPVLESPDQVHAILAVLGYTLVCLLLATFLFNRKEL